MSAGKVAEVAAKVQRLLQSLDDDGRARVLAAAAALYNTPAVPPPGALPVAGQIPSVATPPAGGNPQQFFASKSPNSKIEEIAVAARYRELQLNAHSHTREELQQVFGSARRNFDLKHFKRDISNAKVKGLFTKSNEITLAYYGQQYVDALPERAALKSLKKPKGAKRKGSGKPKKS